MISREAPVPSSMGNDLINLSLELFGAGSRAFDPHLFSSTSTWFGRLAQLHWPALDSHIFPMGGRSGRSLRDRLALEPSTRKPALAYDRPPVPCHLECRARTGDIPSFSPLVIDAQTNNGIRLVFSKENPCPT